MLLSMAVLCVVLGVVARATPVAAVAAKFLGGEAPFSVTDPAALMLLGAALICVGIWTRWYFFRQKKGL